MIKFGKWSAMFVGWWFCECPAIESYHNAVVERCPRCGNIRPAQGRTANDLLP